jgi:uncharacterized protein
MEKESRSFKGEVRAVKGEEKTVVRGYAAVYDSLSENLGGFREMIAPGAFDSVLEDDVRALLNHDSNKILGRNKAGTLRLGVDEKGLWYEYDSPDTSYARDLLVSLERGDVDQSSFQFTVEDDEWKEDEEQRYVRTIKKVRRLYDVSPVTYPAYPDATVALRSLENIKQAQPPKDDPKEDTTWQAESEARARQIRLLKLKQ